MKIYSNRFEENYQDILYTHFSIDYLKSTSFPVTEPRKAIEKVYDKCCRIDYMGLSATNLLDIASNFNRNDKVPKQFITLFKGVEELNGLGIFIKMRFLFMYPYSTSFFALIQAESSKNRCAVDSKEFLRDFHIIDEVDDAMFHASATVNNLKNSLDHLQELIYEYGWNDYGKSPNTLRIRFTPIEVNFSLIIVNNSLFYSPYILLRAFN